MRIYLLAQSDWRKREFGGAPSINGGWMCVHVWPIISSFLEGEWSERGRKGISLLLIQKQVQKMLPKLVFQCFKKRMRDTTACTAS